MNRVRWVPGLVLCVTLVASACSSSAEREPRAPDVSTPSGPGAGPDTSGTPEAGSPEMAVVSHATVPQLRLTAREFERLVAGGVDRWRDFRVVAGARPGVALGEVEADPGVIAVVPLDAVRPTVTVARVARRDPVRDHPDAVSLTVTGDLMLVRGVPDADAALRPIAPRLRAADVTVGNLESTLSTRGRPTQGDDSFGGSPGLIGPLARAGFDALSLANNHTGDFGEGALLDTVAAFRGSDIVPFGAGADLARASRPAYLRAGGLTFALIGFNAIGETPRATLGTPGALSVRMPPRTGPLVPADLDHLSGVIRRADRRADAVVVLTQWGTQYTHRPEPIQRAVARRLVAAGADLVAGGHPHWVQGVESVRGVPVVHSLGNLVFDMDFMEQTMEGVLLESTWLDGRLRQVRFVPYRMDDSTFAPRVVRGTAAAGILADLWSTSAGPYKPSP